MPLLNRILPKELKSTIRDSSPYVFFLTLGLGTPARSGRVIQVAAFLVRISSVQRGGVGSRLLRDRAAAARAYPTTSHERCARRRAGGSSTNRRIDSRPPSSPRAGGRDTRCAATDVHRCRL